MSLMCKMNQTCSIKKGMCSHEKMLLAVMIIGGLAAAGHRLLNGF